MAIKIIIPRLGWSMDEGAFGEWLKADGDVVNAGDPLFTLESEKALQEVESIDSGILRVLPNGPRQGDVIAVGALVGYLVAEGESMPEAPAELPAVEAQPVAPAAAPVTAYGAQDAAWEAARVESTHAFSAALPTISPRAARLARQFGIDWTQLIGSGRTGRVREKDVRAAAGQGGARRPQTMRQVIAERMIRSAHTTAPVTLTTRVDATELVLLRNRFKSRPAERAPTYHDLIALCAARVLLAHPQMNRQWVGGDIVDVDGIHIGIAVDTEGGLLVPVIRDVGKLSLDDLARRSHELLSRARQRKCCEEELRGGTFTITNLGAFGIDAFTPTLNSPETAILGVGAIRREPIALADDCVVVRDRMVLSLTFDHRVVDGAPAARFLQALGMGLENPESYLEIKVS